MRRGQIPHERRLTERLRVHVCHPRPVPVPVAVVVFRGEELGADAEARHFQLVRLGVVSQDRGDDGLLPEERIERVVVVVVAVFALLALAIPLRWVLGSNL